MKLNPNLKDFWTTKKQIKVLYGGRMSSKTMDTAGIILYLASKYKIRIACLRRFQNKLSESVFSTLKRIATSDERLKHLYTTTENTIKSNIGSEFVFMGIQRNLEEIKGLDNINITWIEEAEKLTQDQWNLIRPTILREDNSMCILVFNPDYDTDFVYNEFVMKEHSNVLLRQINYDENIFLSDSAKELIESDRENLDEDDFSNIYDGVPKAENEDAFIKRKWIEAAINANHILGIENRGVDAVGYDIADGGTDTCAIAHIKGNETIHLEEWMAKEDELEQSAEKTFNYALDHNALINYDCIGVGASAGSTFKRLNEGSSIQIEYHKFDAGDKVKNPEEEYQPQRMNKDHFENLKAQMWQEVADRLLHTYNAVAKGKPFDEDMIISISPECANIDKLKRELSSPKKDKSKRGLVKVESKDDLKKRGIPSPNCFVAGTKVLTPGGNVNIEDLLPGDYVITPMGKSKITHIHKSTVDNIITNRGLTGTKDHKIFTWNKGWVPLRFLSLCDIIEESKERNIKWQIMNLLYIKAKCSQFSTRVDTIVQEDMEGRMLEMSDFYTGGYGLKQMGKFLQGITSTTLMMIGEITRLRTWSVSKLRNITNTICKKDSKTIHTEKKTESNYSKHQRKLKNGIDQKRGGNGINNMQKKYLVEENTKTTFVKFVKSLLLPGEHIHQKHVLKNVLSKEQTKEQKAYTPLNVENAEQYSHMKSLDQEISTKDVPGNAHMLSRGEVYNITLDKHNVYYANDILVRNCADAFIMSYYKGEISTSFLDVDMSSMFQDMY